MWLKKKILPNSGHYRARKLVRRIKCERCGTRKKRLDVHHLDGDPTNNVLSNLQVLCRSCHNLVHDRKKTCRICGRPQVARSLCGKHYKRLTEHGDPCYERPKAPTICSECGARASTCGLCHKHYMRRRRAKPTAPVTPAK